MPYNGAPFPPIVLPPGSLQAYLALFEKQQGTGTAVSPGDQAELDALVAQLNNVVLPRTGTGPGLQTWLHLPAAPVDAGDDHHQRQPHLGPAGACQHANDATAAKPRRGGGNNQGGGGCGPIADEQRRGSCKMRGDAKAPTASPRWLCS